MGSQVCRGFERESPVLGLGQMLLGAMSLGAVAMAQSGPLVLEREGRLISLEPYAPNILRVTMSTDKAAAIGAPGYGFVAKPSAEGWTHEQILTNYPHLKSEDIAACLHYAGSVLKQERVYPIPA